ncbi:MAG: lasso peptide biosynthesis protein [Proteobacteria bacterium]|nr:lasso peptide biosynthesis protein [Pseudomonadota bacterium]MBU1708815.1 lasso peptide biosynthesis protein [Pseudomonadota bacterium]
MKTRLWILKETLVAACKVYISNRLGSNRWIPLPEVIVQEGDIPSGYIDAVVQRIDRVIRFVARNTGHLCLYLGYARAVVLRKLGTEAILNIGLNNCSAGKKIEGHCWLSINDRVVYEDKDQHLLYPLKMGASADSATTYWIGQADEELLIHRLKKG